MSNREQFEAWLTSLPGFELADVEKRDDGKYSYSETEWCWKSWKASREAIEIVMPTSVITTEVGPAISHEKMIARLAVNGLKVKS
ncbi:hypothetical protein [Pantoea brenneri]|uniref:hypothetical protein n=1 Tax=Pantoea brenneri TaxID=472694 RepID=UPI00289A1474|nr:hypothetical protein [Pantoea brenneri]